jgi:hypothetical protein
MIGRCFSRHTLEMLHPQYQSGALLKCDPTHQSRLVRLHSSLDACSRPIQWLLSLSSRSTIAYRIRDDHPPSETVDWNRKISFVSKRITTYTYQGSPTNSIWDWWTRFVLPRVMISRGVLIPNPIGLLNLASHNGSVCPMAGQRRWGCIFRLGVPSEWEMTSDFNGISSSARWLARLSDYPIVEP